jgi:S-adenosylmethionine/arginine decarboxylase-like enzyme
MSPDIKHKHLIVRAEVTNPLATAEGCKDWLRSIVEALEMKILSGPHSEYCDKCGNKGVTGVVIIETSHIAVHIWDECSPAIVQFDVYTCGELHEEKIFEKLSIMQPVKVEWKYLDREKELTEVKKGLY